MRSRRLLLLAGLATVALLQTGELAAQTPPSKSGSEVPFALADKDRIVVVGDSITVSGHYVRYLETYLRTRFPDWKLSCRNAGINGQTATGGFDVIEADVLVWKPTVVIVNYGMNDGRRAGGVSYYQTGITRYVDRLLAAGVRVILCSNSPLDIGDAPEEYSDYNRHFDEMAKFAAGLAAQRKLPFVDQFHFCHRVWGENRRRREPIPVSDQTLAQHPSDFVHARQPGQLTMAYIILKSLGAPAEVSFAQIDASRLQATTRNCRIEALARGTDERGLTFTRTDTASPCWIDDRGALGLELVPFQEELNRMPLVIMGLPAGKYELTIDEFRMGRYSDKELAAGVNLAVNRQSLLYGPGRKVAQRIEEQARQTGSAREIMRFQPPEWLRIDALAEHQAREWQQRMVQIEAKDGEIAAAAQPVSHRYHLVRASE